MQAEYMEASTQVFNQLQKDPSTMNNPAVWLDAYTEELTSRAVSYTHLTLTTTMRAEDAGHLRPFTNAGILETRLDGGK